MPLYREVIEPWSIVCFMCDLLGGKSGDYGVWLLHVSLERLRQSHEYLKSWVKAGSMYLCELVNCLSLIATPVMLDAGLTLGCLALAFQRLDSGVISWKWNDFCCFVVAVLCCCEFDYKIRNTYLYTYIYIHT